MFLEPATPIAPENLLIVTFCGCCSTEPCRSKRCGCKKRDVKYSALCKCQGKCGNGSGTLHETAEDDLELVDGYPDENESDTGNDSDSDTDNDEFES